MRWLKSVISAGLVLAALAVAISTGLSDHSDDYGQVGLPQGGVLHLPDGRVTVFYSQLGDNSDPLKQNSVPLGFAVVSTDTGAAVPIASENGAQSAFSVTRSESVGDLGAVAKLDVPTAGDYAVRGTTDLPAGTAFLKFGTNAGAALLSRWRLLAGLLLAAFLVALIPTPRHQKRWEDEGEAPSGWSSDPRAPYVG